MWCVSKRVKLQEVFALMWCHKAECKDLEELKKDHIPYDCDLQRMYIVHTFPTSLSTSSSS